MGEAQLRESCTQPGESWNCHVKGRICSTILYAILAVSARHQSSSSDEMRLFADECQQNCLKALIPALNDYENAIQETVFASAVILRLFEEMTDAAFIVTLRQEIFVANLIQRPVGSITEHCNIDMSLVASSDVMWAFRAIAHAAKVTDFAYDNVSFRTRDRWESLMQYLQDWEALRPASFNPIYREEGNPQSCPFPKLWYCNDYHVAARQYTELSRILLLASDPDTCQMRIGRMRTGRNNDATIRDCVRVICGVALSNTEYMPARLTAGFVISMCGELFHQPDETRVLLAMLSDAESYLGWPCLKSKDDLQRLWGLPD
ncbi:uncharacterized protein ATNIH1004_005393 [Aspergillus tanneri]|uniref:ARCA protein n=1 Tax=Aspergillus tanneri TaxID=1220188 RepID=A0A5M9MIC6_9EURO|nr:uncharacterized protein ATNIH1004_005393 [Aspergillus tanneri]KAA8646718.1 hypothetical protein ATNIH1004_005393 [Aspergillus tanneri]